VEVQGDLVLALEGLDARAAARTRAAILDRPQTRQ
jgi:hypothetical protein